MIDEEKNSKEHYKSKVEELKDRLQSISSDHQQELENVKAKYSEQIAECKEENQSKVFVLFTYYFFSKAVGKWAPFMSFSIQFSCEGLFF